MINTNIYLVRHAHSIYTPDELNRPLSNSGISDAERVTALLSRENITHVISSPYKRAAQTVEGIARLNGLDIIIDDGFKERKLTDSFVDNFEEAVHDAWMDFDYTLPGGESGYDAQYRGIKSLKDIMGKYDGGNITIGTHGNIMVLMMNYFDKKYDYNFWKGLSMPDIYKLGFDDGKLIEVKHIWEEGIH